MKNILKICISIGIIIYAFNGTAQNVKRIEFDTNIIVGKWIATEDEKSFELQIVKDTLLFPLDKTYFEALRGSILYREKGEIIRTTNIDGYNSFILAVILTPSKIDILLNDQDRKIMGTGEMVIDSNNPNKATWKLRKNEMRMSHPDWNLVDFDIPTELEWTKIE